MAIKDNEDPWGMTVDRFDNKIGEMELLSDREANDFCGYPDAEIDNVRVIENGNVQCVIQAFYKFEKSIAHVTYTIPKKTDCVDVKIKMLTNDVNRMYKFVIDTRKNGDFLGQTAFGVRNLEKDGREVNFHQWCGIDDVYILNRGTYAGSSEKGEIRISLLRTPVYSAHPIGSRKLCEDDRFSEHIDIGEREFEFRIVCGDDLQIERLAQSYNMMPYALSFFPCGEGEKIKSLVEIVNANILMTNITYTNSCYSVRFYNSSNRREKSQIRIMNWQGEIDFTPYEVKTFIYKDSRISECDMLNNII